jgi:uncharacterized protein (TIGR00730 family)
MNERGREARRGETSEPLVRREHEPLPVSLPKSPLDDPQALERVRRLLASPTYVRADDDTDFLHRDEVRPVRLQLEYLKTELTLVEHGIESTIVLFGGTRIVEPASARRYLEEVKARLAEDPDDTELLRLVGVAERLVAKSVYYDVAREFARLVSESRNGDGKRCELVITTGGGPGIMEAGNRGAFDAGRPSIGLNITLPMEQFPNPYIAPELCFQFRYFGLRKLHFIKRAKALVAFPGGYGTFDEVFDALCLVQTHKIEPIPIILVGESFWRRAFDAEFLAAEGVIAPRDLQLFRYAETAEEIWAMIRDWYAADPRRALARPCP